MCGKRLVGDQEMVQASLIQLQKNTKQDIQHIALLLNDLCQLLYLFNLFLRFQTRSE
jgi:hypothetical protein